MQGRRARVKTGGELTHIGYDRAFFISGTTALRFPWRALRLGRYPVAWSVRRSCAAGSVWVSRPAGTALQAGACVVLRGAGPGHGLPERSLADLGLALA